MLLVCLHVRRPRRLRHLRRLADVPVTVTRLPGRPLPAPPAATVPRRLPDGFRPATTPAPAPTALATADADELAVRAWLHHDQHGHTDADTEVRR
ncbi:hypothetical protein [Streptomyces sp. ML-6]|uniref:hypothetical protein n=1 Tax=Streptomyces sp. ML-6 TaxID=2982693 RepID=UPI0024C056B0|nr:hypothetical protein [Streptomyces sp. ML-6]MDK0524844.1 hypothetical protein [Streptomyces sp. ML-6]